MSLHAHTRVTRALACLKVPPYFTVPMLTHAGCSLASPGPRAISSPKRTTSEHGLDEIGWAEGRVLNNSSHKRN